MRKATVTGAALGATATAMLIAARQRSRVHSNGHRSASSRKTRVVVAGAGFAGIGVLKELRNEVSADEAEILLIDRQNYHLFTPLVYQVATGSVDAANISYPVRPFCYPREIGFLCAEITNINVNEQFVDTSRGRVDYDVLVVGMGSQTNFFGMSQVEEHTYDLKSIQGANQIRRQILACVERAARSTDPDERQRLLTFVVVGAGATGVELVGSLQDLLHRSLVPYYPEIDHEEAQIILIEATDTILPGLNEKMRETSINRFKDLGIKLMLNTAVSNVDQGMVYTRDGRTIPAETVVWSAGVRANEIVAGLPLEKHRDGRIAVDEYLRVPGHPNVFVLGDSAYARDLKSKEAFAPNASVAVQQGETTARNIGALIRGGPLHPFRFRHLGELIALGRGHATAQLGPVTLDGIPAWIVWRFVYLAKLMGMTNRAGVVVDWISTIFAQRDIANIDA